MIAKVVMIQKWPVEDVMRFRVDFFREEGDVGYEEHYIQVPDTNSDVWIKGYKGERDFFQMPVDWTDYDKWLDTVPKIWRNNPCLCKLVQLPLSTPRESVIQLITDHAERVKSVGTDVKDPTIKKQFLAQLKDLGLSSSVKPVSITGLEATDKTSTLLDISVRK